MRHTGTSGTLNTEHREAKPPRSDAYGTLAHPLKENHEED